MTAGPEKTPVSRRTFITSATLGAVAVTGGFVYTIASRRRGIETGNTNAALDTEAAANVPTRPRAVIRGRLPVPSEPIIDSFHFSPVDGQLAVVAGGMLSKRLYVAEFPPQSPDDYRLVANLPNCIDLVAPTWCRNAPDRMAFLATVIDSDIVAPEITDDKAVKTALEKMGLAVTNVTDHFRESLYTISKAGSAAQKVCELDWLPNDGTGAGMVWPETGHIISCEDKQIRKYPLQEDGSSGKPQVLFEVKENAPELREAFRYIAYRPQDDLFVTLRIAFHDRHEEGTGFERWTDVLMFDAEGKIHEDVRVSSASSADDPFQQVFLDKNGEAYLKSTQAGTPAETLHLASFPDGTPQELPFDPAKFFLKAFGKADGQMVFVSKSANTPEDRYFIGAM